MVLAGDGPVSADAWHAFWDSLEGEATGAGRAEAVALLEALRDRMPDPETAGALVTSLAARRPRTPELDAVNIVGSGGGPETANLSTAAAIVAAAIGVRVVKSGSRGYSSRYGSLDALKLLRVPLAGSDDEVAASVEWAGIAFAGPFVHPPELARLARRVFPRDWRTLGSFVNRLGPFLAAVPATSQITGVSNPALVPLYLRLMADHRPRRVWLCDNSLGIDELVSFEANVIRRDDGTPFPLDSQALGASPGSLADLRRPADADAVARQLTALLAGDGPAAAVESICLNAAAMAVIGGLEPDWGAAFAEARSAVRDGRATALLERLRTTPGTGAPARRRSLAAASHG
jgi:anthranilate phosphoribosyltransferase